MSGQTIEIDIAIDIGIAIGIEHRYFRGDRGA